MSTLCRNQGERAVARAYASAGGDARRARSRGGCVTRTPGSKIARARITGRQATTGAHGAAIAAYARTKISSQP